MGTAIQVDGFDNYTDPSLKWILAINLTAEIQPTAGRDGRGAFHGREGWLTQTVPAVSGYTIGFAFKGENGGGKIIRVGDTSTFSQISVSWNVTNFTIIRESDGATLGTSSVGLPIDTWTYLEFTFKISSSITLGDVVLRMNYTPIITVAGGTSTVNGTHTLCNLIGFGSISGALNAFDCWVDDAVILPLSEGFWGDVTVDGKVPDAQGNYAQFTPHGAAANWQCVNDANPDGDTTYVGDVNINDRDSYKFGSPTHPIQEVKAMQLSVTAKSAAALGLKPFFRQSGTNYDQSRDGLTSSYETSVTQYSVNPATGVAWTAAEIAALEAGVKVVT